jgi:hypothetical protein
MIIRTLTTMGTTTTTGMITGMITADAGEQVSIPE